METGKWKLENGKTQTAINRLRPDGATAGRIRDFKDLKVWQAARELRKEIHRLARALPEFEKFGLAGQLRRASTSVTANLAEGFGRFGYHIRRMPSFADRRVGHFTKSETI